MALQVKPLPPAPKLTVTYNYGMQGSTYNPQQTYNPQGANYNPQRTYNPQPQTYNPQRTASGGWNWTRAQQRQWAANEAAKRAREYQETLRRQEAYNAMMRAKQKQKWKDDQNNKIKAKKGLFASMFNTKLAEALARRLGKKRTPEIAWDQAEANANGWFGLIESEKRKAENDEATRALALLSASRDMSEEEWNKRVSDHYAEFDNRLGKVNKTIDRYNAEQKRLGGIAMQRSNTKSGKILQGVGKGINTVVGTPFRILNQIASQTSRGVNTLKNVARPNSIRTYYGGGEAKGGIKNDNWVRTLKNAYNVSKDQRIIGFTKARQAQLEKALGKKRYGSLSMINPRQTVRYGDDIANILADPLSWVGGRQAGRVINKASALRRSLTAKAGNQAYAFAGKNNFLRDRIITHAAKSGNTLPSRATQWLFKKQDNVGRQGRFFNEHLPAWKITHDQQMKSRRKSINAMAFARAERNRIKAELDRTLKSYKATKSQYDGRNIERFSKMDDRVAELVFKFRNQIAFNEGRATKKKPLSWDGIDTTGLTAKDKKKIMKTAYLVGESYRKLYAGGAKHGERYQYRRGYNPVRWRKKPFNPLDEARTGKAWYTKAQEVQQMPDAKTIKESAKARLLAQVFKENPDASRAVKLTDYDKKLQDEIQRLYGKVKKSHDIEKTKLTPFERLVGRNPVKPDQDWQEKVRPLTIANRRYGAGGLWRKSVLAMNPAWYVNNIGSNFYSLAASSGVKGFSELGKITKSGSRGMWEKHIRRNKDYKTYHDKLKETVPTALKGNIEREYGEKARLGTAIEDAFRNANFSALKKADASDDEALQLTDRWFFNYSNRNIERPLKTVFPFWNWTKNLTRLGATMPFTNPRAAKSTNELYDKFYRRPYEALPDGEQSYVDPDTGSKVSYNPKEMYKGRLKVGDNWYNTPFFAFNPESMLNIGVNPYLMTGIEAANGEDRYGNTIANRKLMELLLEKFPQANLAMRYRDAGKSRFERWFTPSYMGKEKQGQDPKAPNYSASLDNMRRFKRSVKGFFGVPNAVKFDKKEFDTKTRLTKFNSEWFGIDWDKRLDELTKEAGDKQFGFNDPNSPYAKRKAEQEALARKHGFDLQKDIYDNYWSKYDTETTKRTKRYKQQAFQHSRDFWEGYHALPKGDRTHRSQRRPYTLAKFDEWERSGIFGKNPYLKFPNKLNPVALRSQEAKSAGKGKSRAVQWNGKWFKTPESRDRYIAGLERRKRGYRKTAVNWNGKWFKSAASRDRYIAYMRGNKSGRRSSTAVEYNGKWFKSPETRDKYKRAEKWKEYYALKTPDERRAWIRRHPELKLYDEPTTREEWDMVRARVRQSYRAKAAKLPRFEEIRQMSLADIMRHLPPPTKTRSKRLVYK